MDLISNFFTHKDFLPPASEIAGTMFTPLHFCFAAVLLVYIIFLLIHALPYLPFYFKNKKNAKKKEKELTTA